MFCIQISKNIVKAAFSTLLLAGIFASAQDTSTVEGRTEYLQKLQQILPSDPYFDKWLAKTNALPPDFSKLPKQNDIPDPLTFLDGRKVATPADWAERRKEIDSLSQQYVWGKVPPKPKIDQVVVLDETHGKGYVTRNLRLIFGPEDKGNVRVRVVIPDGDGPFPVLINDNLLGWAPELIRRGYISAGYAGNDFMDDADALAQLYPDYDFALLPRRAWVASLVVDYLDTLPQVDQKHIAIWGASRGGKMVAIAAALDTRIAAVIAVSTGVGGVLSWRDSGEVGIGEGIETTTRRFATWFAPGLRFFTGREDRLPVDGNLVAAMIAPRPLLMTWGNNDQVANTWGDEDTYYSALKVYQLLGVPDRIGTMRVPGFHGANDEQADLDWLDIQFGRSRGTWTSNLIFRWDWEKWRSETHQSAELGSFPKHDGDDDLSSVHSVSDWDAKSAELRKSVNWMLGTTPPKLTDDETMAGRRRLPQAAPGAPNPGQVTPDIPAWAISLASQLGNQYGWTEPQKSHLASRRVSFAGGITGDLYYPAGTAKGTKLPTVIWLHGYSYQLGYMWGYREDTHPILALVQAGYAVFAFDQSGFGSRLSETSQFYSRYPQWSHMGRLIDDAESAIDFLQKDELVDPQKIYLYGYSLGGSVAIYTAALDSRVKGIVAVAGFTPMRSDTAATGTGGVARLSKTRDILPRLGFFVGHESQIPYDFDDLIAMIAPRPVLIVQPQLDREATPSDVHNAVDQARKVYTLYSAGDHLTLSEPWDFNRLPNSMLNDSVQWMLKNAQ
jgi:pimeloyl-ACP methyl ester carboxylesterase